MKQKNTLFYTVISLLLIQVSVLPASISLSLPFLVIFFFCKLLFHGLCPFFWTELSHCSIEDLYILWIFFVIFIAKIFSHLGILFSLLVICALWYLLLYKFNSLVAKLANLFLYNFCAFYLAWESLAHVKAQKISLVFFTSAIFKNFLFWNI